MPITTANFATLSHEEFLEMLFKMSYSEIRDLHHQIDETKILANCFASRRNPLNFDNRYSVFEWLWIMTNINNTLDTFDPNNDKYDYADDDSDDDNSFDDDSSDGGSFSVLAQMLIANGAFSKSDSNTIERDFKRKFDQHTDLFKKFHAYNVPGNGFICDFFARLKSLNPLLTTCIEELFAKISA